jgi:hypothetical protein
MGMYPYILRIFAAFTYVQALPSVELGGGIQHGWIYSVRSIPIQIYFVCLDTYEVQATCAVRTYFIQTATPILVRT